MKNLDREKVYVVGVSGGPDSMALLDQARKDGLKLIVAHMNYLKRDSAYRDEEIVRNYCEKYQLICEVKHQREVCNTNFQAFAREKRYHFYKELCDQYQASGVLLAHHLDDHLETYLMQKQRKSQCDYYGIAKQVELYGCNVYRVLLDVEKKTLIQYCEEHQIKYGIDESNLSDDYTRNKIRHEVIEKLSYEEKLKMKLEIQNLNDQQQKKLQELDSFIQQWDERFDSLLVFEEEKRKDILDRWIYLKTKEHCSRKEMNMIYNICKDKSFHRTIHNQYELEFVYGRLYIYEKKDISYHYEIHSFNEFETPYFKIKKEGKVIEGITVDQKELPLFIRPYQKGDKIKLRLGTKKLSRFFIDRKIPMHLRKNYPVVLNNKGEIIFVAGIGCEIKHFSNNPNLFVVQ